MWRLAYRQLTYDLTRSFLTAFAISAAIAVILILKGFEQGLYIQSERVVLSRGGQLILAQAGVSNFLAVRSSLPQLTRGRVESIDGVSVAHPITGFWAIYGPEGNKFPLLLLVYDTLGGPVHIVEGRPISDSRDVIIDIGLGRKFDLKPGDPLVISDFEFRVAGITRNSSALFSTFAFVTYDGMIDLFLESEIAPDITTFPLLSFLLVELEPGVEPRTVAQAIEDKVADVDVFKPQELAHNDVELGKELFGPVMGVLIMLSFIIGLLVIGLIIYSDVSSRRHSFGVLKALGFRLSHMVKGVLAQTLLLVLLAFPIGVFTAFVVATVIEWNAPVYMVHVLDPEGLANTFSGVILMMVLGGLLPLRLIARTDPVIAFQVE